MSVEKDLHDIVRSKQFKQSSPSQQQEFVVGYFKNRHPAAEARAVFSNFPESQQLQEAAEAIRRASEESTGETLQRSIETTSRVVAPALGTLGLTGAGPVTAAAVPSAMIGEFIPEITKPFLTDQAADLHGALERSAYSGSLALLLGPFEGATQAIFGKAGQLRTRIFNKPQFKDSRGNKIQDPDVTAARSVLEPRGGGLTLGQQRGTGRAFFENITRNAIGGEGAFAKLDRANEVAIDKFADEIAGRIGKAMPADQLGAYVRDQIMKQRPISKQIASQMFDKVDAAAGGIQTIQDDALDYLTTHQYKPAIKKIFSMFNAGKVGGKKGIEELLGKDKNGVVPYKQAEEALHEMNKIINELERKGELTVSERAIVIKKKIQDQLDLSLERLSPDLKKQAIKARDFWKSEIAEKIDHRTINDLLGQLKDTPGAYPKVILNGGIDLLKQVKAITSKATPSRINSRGKRIPGSPPTWPETQTSLLSIILGRSSDPVKGEFSGLRKLSGRQLLQQLKSLDEGTSEYVKELTDGGAFLDDFRKLAVAIDKAGASVDGSGGVFIKLKQSGEVTKAAASGLQLFGAGSAVSSGSIVGAGAFVFTPALLSRWFTNRRAMKNLAEGLIGGPWSKAGTRLLALAAVESDKAQEGLRDIMDQPVQSVKNLIQRPDVTDLPPQTFEPRHTIEQPRSTRPTNY